MAAAVVGDRVTFGMLNNDAIAASISEFSCFFGFGLRSKLRSSDILSFQCIWCIGAVFNGHKIYFTQVKIHETISQEVEMKWGWIVSRSPPPF